MFYKIRHNFDYSLHCKLHQFAKPIRITWYKAQQNNKTVVVAMYNTYQFSWCFNYSTVE